MSTTQTTVFVVTRNHSSICSPEDEAAADEGTAATEQGYSRNVGECSCRGQGRNLRHGSQSIE